MINRRGLLIDHMRWIQDRSYRKKIRAVVRERELPPQGIAVQCHTSRECCAIEPLDTTVTHIREALHLPEAWGRLRVDYGGSET